MIDLNLPLGDAALNLGIKSQYSTINALEGFDRLDSNFLETLLVHHSSGLWLLSAPSEWNPYNPTDEAIGNLLRVALEDFEFIVIDAGSKLDLKRTYQLDSSATFYLVTQLGIPELRNANRFIKQFPSDHGPTLEVVVNRFDSGSQGIDEGHVAQALTLPFVGRFPTTTPPFARCRIRVSRSPRETRRLRRQSGR